GGGEMVGGAGACQTAPAVFEHRRIVGQFLCLTIHHFVHPYWAVVVQAQMKEPHLEAPAVLGPERLVSAVVNGLVLIPVEGLHRLGDMTYRRLVDAGSECPCL